MTRRSLGMVAGGLWAAALVLAWLVAGADAPVGPDASIADAVHGFVGGQTWLIGIARIYAVAGSVVVLLPLTVAVVVGLARAGHGSWAWWIGLAGMGGWMISQTVKYTVDRERPVWTDPFALVDSPSFPSGHAMAGIYGWFAFGIVAWSLGQHRLGIALMAFGVTMGPSRVVLGVHWPTDVLEGWLLAGAWLCTLAVLVRPGYLEIHEGAPNRTQNAPPSSIPRDDAPQ